MTQVIFTNPRTSATYTWPANPTAEQPAGKAIAIERTSNTGNVGATDQQGDDGAYVLGWTVIVPTSAMQTALWQWYELSKLQTIYLTDWNGQQFEGQIIALTPQRLIDGDEFTTFDFQFRVYRFISGIMATAGVTP